MRKAILLLLAASLMLSACQAEPTPTDPLATPQATNAGEVQPTTAAPAGDAITIRFTVDEFEKPLYTDLIEAFETDNPGIRVQMVSTSEILGLGPLGGEWPDDGWTRLASSADVLTMFTGNRGVSEQGLIRDLRPFIDADGSFQPDDFLPHALSQFQWDGGTWGVPVSAYYQLIFFDKKAFDEANESYPKPGWTWDEFLSKAQALTVRDGDTVTRWGFVQSWPSHVTFIEPRAGPLVDASTEPPTPRFDDPAVIDAVRWYADLHLEHQVTPFFEPPESDGSTPVLPEGYQLIEAGKAAMWYDTTLSFKFRKQQNPELGVAPYPVDSPQSGSSPLYVTGLSMSAGTANPDVAWRFISFLSRQTINMGPFADVMSARRSVTESSGFWDKIDPELASALRYAIDHAYVSAGQPGYGAFNDAIESILKGEQSVEDALAEAQTKAETEIEEALAARASATPAPTIVVSGGDDEPPAGATTISFVVVSIDPTPIRDLAKRFRETHPDIVVEINLPNFTSGSIDMPDIAASADCFHWYPFLQDPDNLDAILSLEPFLDADPSFSTDDFYPALLEQFTEQGQLWGLPADVGPYVIEYNQDLFDAAGVAYPTLDWTMDDFLAAAVALTKGDGETKQYGFVGDYYESTDLLLMIERLGARLIDDSIDPPNVAFDDPATVRAVQWYADLYTQHGVKPVFVTDISELVNTTAILEREALISDGRAAMWTRYGAQPDLGLGDRSQLNIGVAPLPRGSGGAAGGSFLTSSGYFISADAEARQACWQWITFLTGQPEATTALPARRSVAESDAYRQRVGEDLAAAYRASLGDGTAPSTYQILIGEDSWLGNTIIWLSSAYGQIVDGEATAAPALAKAQDMADEYRACVVSHDALSDEKQQRACLKEVDPSIPDFLLGTSE